MKIELHFDESIYRKQMKLLYEMGYGRKRTYLKNSNYLGFAFVLLGFLIVLKKRDIGYLFILFGLYNLISYYNFYFKQKKLARKYTNCFNFFRFLKFSKRQQNRTKWPILWLMLSKIGEKSEEFFYRFFCICVCVSVCYITFLRRVGRVC